MARDVVGDPGTWEVARALGKQLIIPVGPYEPRVPTAEEMNAVLPYLINRATRHYEREYYCENAEVALAHLLGMNVPRQGFPRSDGYSRHNLDWEGYDKDGLDSAGRDREGFNRYGFNREGYNREGYDQYGYDKDGYDKDGRDRDGQTRDEALATLVGTWSPEFAAIIAEQINARMPAEKKTPAKRAPRKAAAKKAATAAVAG
jgi:hypothetical protein